MEKEITKKPKRTKKPISASEPAKKSRKKSDPIKSDPDNIPYIPDVIEYPVKHILKSKIIWINVIALVSLIIQQKYGFIISAEIQGELLVVVNIILRTLSKSKLTLK